MNLNDIIQAAQGGQGVANLANQFGLTPDQAQAAVQAMMPAFSTALQKAPRDPSEPRRHRLAAGERRPSGFVHRSPTPPPRRRTAAPRSSQIFGSSQIASQIASPRVERHRRRRADDPTDDAGGRLDAARRPRPCADRARFGGVLGQLTSAAQTAAARRSGRRPRRTGHLAGRQSVRRRPIGPAPRRASPRRA